MLADAASVAHVYCRMSARGIFTLGTALAACWLPAQEPGAVAEPAPASPTEISAPAGKTAPVAVAAAPALTTTIGVYVIPVRDQIAAPILFVIRRGLKEATEKGITNVVLDMDTPGGDGATMLEIMETLDKFAGLKITYVNSEAISAGAIIAAVSDEIYFSPKGVMGAADVVTATGENIPEALKRKIDSYLGAKIEVYSKHAPRRAEVIKAMRIPDFELTLDETVLKPKGELLTLTAEKAIALYGEPPTPLLAVGIADSLDALLASKFPGQKIEKFELEVTWSERLAQYLTKISPLLLGLGLLALFIEFKTPGFGVFGISGILLLTVVFLSSSVAGLAGNEAILVFGLGLLLVAAEIFFFPGLIFPAVLGVGLMFGSLVWALADIWPGQPIEFTADTFLGPIGDVMFGIVIAIVGAVVLARVIPRSLLWDRLVLNTALAANPDGTATLSATSEIDSLIGKRGRALTDLFPSGQVEVDGRRYAAQLNLGSVDAGEEIVVAGRGSFGLFVEKPRQ
jgi:membrane-bound serine protease (ClpP class)